MQDFLPLGGRLERVEQALQSIHPLDAFARNLPPFQLRPRPVDDLIGVAAQHVSHGAVERFGIAAEVAPKCGDRRRLGRHDARDVRIPRPGADRRQRRDQAVQQHRRLHERRHVIGVVEVDLQARKDVAPENPQTDEHECPSARRSTRWPGARAAARSRNSIITISVYLRRTLRAPRVQRTQGVLRSFVSALASAGTLKNSGRSPLYDHRTGAARPEGREEWPRRMAHTLHPPPVFPSEYSRRSARQRR